MKHIVQTGRETVSLDADTGHSRVALVDKVTIGCASAKEAQEIADGMGTLPNRRAFAGVELYTEGGVKLVLSYRDMQAIAEEYRELDRSGISLNLAAY